MPRAFADLTRRACGIVALCAAATASASAQVAVGSGAIVARVRDASGKPVVGALVRAVGPTTREATTNVAGVVVLGLLPTGRYDVSVSRTGYTPFASRIAVERLASAPLLVAPVLQSVSFAESGDGASAALPSGTAGATADPFTAHALEALPVVETVARAGVPGISLDGTMPYESRVELDGIPLAGGVGSPAALRFRDVLGLDAIDTAPAPFVESLSLQNAIGGIALLRTPAVDGARAAGVETGYDSAFGSYSHARAVDAFGPLAFALDTVAGGGSNRSQAFKARYAFSQAASVDVASYGLQASGTIGDANVTTVAPAYAAGVRLSVGSGTFDARTFASALAVSTSLASPFVANETARTAGLQLGYDLPLGAGDLRVSFDRRGEHAAIANAPDVAQTFTTFAVRGTFALARALSAELGDAYAGGTLVAPRNDPAAALTYRPASTFVVRLAGGRAYATAPDDLLATRTAASPALAPETAFGVRLRADATLASSDRAWVSAFRERRFATFVSFANATDTGVDAGYTHAPARGFGGLAYVSLAHDTYDGASPSARIAVFAEALPTGYEPPVKARAELTLRTGPACESRLGATFVGNGNALAGRALALGDVSVCVAAFSSATLRVGEANVFGAVVSDPLLAPLYRPHEFFSSVGFGTH